MAKAPQDLTLTILREIRGDVAHLRERSDQTTAEWKALGKEIRDWQETTATATGFAIHADIREHALEEKLNASSERVEELEEAK